MTTTAIYGILIVVCIVIAAFFSMVETAFSSVNTIRLHSLADSGGRKSKKAESALKVTKNFDKVLTTILIMNNVVNFACSSVSTLLCMDLFGNLGAAISTGATTFLVLTFGEITPKCIGKENSESIALYTAGILRGLTVLLTPLVYFFIGVKTLALRLTKTDNSPSVTEQELRYIIENMEEQGVLEAAESDMVQSAFEFDEKTVQTVITPRVDVIALDIDDEPVFNRDIIIKERCSRIPVYKDSPDNIIGILYSREYLEALIASNGTKPALTASELNALLKPPYFIYKTKKLNQVLSEFKKNQINMAIVTDEYGGTLGLVTMEDLLEEIVGEIWDEDEEAETMYAKNPAGGYTVSGDMELEELFELFGTDSKKSGINSENEALTVGGFIHNNLDKIPQIGESFEAGGLVFTVDDAADQRVIRASVKMVE
ncbi:MAG: hemolysin family protein [Oscillospiraceae bacterium]|nr:hemolysin family protein [Oscillospiraceae bacterium]